MTRYQSLTIGLAALAAALAPNKLAISERAVAFDDLRPLVVRSRNFLKASGAAKQVAEDAEQFVRKLSGGKKKPKAKAAAAGSTSTKARPPRLFPTCTACFPFVFRGRVIEAPRGYS